MTISKASFRLLGPMAVAMCVVHCVAAQPDTPQPYEVSLARSVSAADELDAVRVLARECSTPYGVLRLQESGPSRNRTAAAKRVYAEAGHSMSQAIQMLNEKFARYGVRSIGGMLVATDKNITDSVNPLLVVVRNLEYKGTVGGLFQKITKEVLNMGPPMYAFSNASGQEMLALPIEIETDEEQPVVEILAQMSRVTELNWQITLMPNARELTVDRTSNKIHATSKTRLMVTLGRATK